MAHYITFKQAKKLKEKGFNTPIRKVYNTLGQLWDAHYTTMTNDDVDSGACCTAPEHWQVVDWLLEKHGIWVLIDVPLDFSSFTSCVIKKGEHSMMFREYNFKTPQEAYSAAFDYILDNLI